MTQATVAPPPVTEDVPVIKIGNATFRLIFHDLYRPLTDGEYAGLKDSIERHGIRQDITVVSHGNLVFDVIDGAHRLKAAAELGYKLERIPKKETIGTPDELRDLAETLNEDRRQLTVEERRERALKLRQQGQSYRQIGEALGVDPMTARKDVKKAEEKGVDTSTPATVTGKDGKAYPATAPEIPEREIEIVRDLVAEVLPSWTKPIEAGHITNAVRRRPGGAEVSVRAVRAALERMIEAGNVVKSRNAQNYVVYALAIKPDEQGGEAAAPEEETGATAWLNTPVVKEKQPEPTAALVPATEPPANGNSSIHFSSESAEWYTPPSIIERVVEALGDIDLDPCSNSHTAPHVPAKQHYVKEDDGLSKEWSGAVFLNPPYGREIAQWVEKLVAEHAAGHVPSAIALVPARTDTAWFAALRDYPRCFIQGRIKFLTSEGVETDPAPFPSMAVYLGPDRAAFIKAFSPLGDIYARVEAE